MTPAEHKQLKTDYQAAEKGFAAVIELQHKLLAEAEAAQRELKQLTDRFPRLLADFHLKKPGVCENVVLKARCKIAGLKVTIEDNPLVVKELDREKQQTKNAISKLRDTLSIQDAFVATVEKGKEALSQRLEYRKEVAEKVKEAAIRAGRLPEAKDLINSLRQQPAA